jgi:hypothetical protein
MLKRILNDDIAFKRKTYKTLYNMIETNYSISSKKVLGDIFGLFELINSLVMKGIIL